ncbi:sigma-54 dependent transcriptional regulator [Puniceicoccaceae bacterium K14]|nr:sigma-54 dependent transcriptional regulator [Puniceicoccaceae bacterium K14]
MSSLLAGREILIVDDENLLRKRLARFLETRGANVTAVATYSEASNALESLSFDFALFDVHLPDGIGIDLLSQAKGVTSVIMTADGGVESAVRAMRLGAADYLSKPFDMEEIVLVLSRCASNRQSERSREHRQAAATVNDGDIHFGESQNELKAKLERILSADRRLQGKLPPVLIEGETGTGKSTLAKWLHANGPRKSKELVVVNCAALPESLAESELFGHEKGSFTDAKEKRIGLFEAADGGTLFLDEIASLSPALQAKTLVAIDEGKIRRVGASREVLVDVRLIAASNQNLKALSREGQFREDLYHRLNLLHVEVPPLRSRPNDTISLANHLATGIARRYRLDSLSFSKRGENQLRAYDWPGNIRELAHEIERAIVLGDPTNLDFPTLQGLLVCDEADESSEGDWLNPAWSFPEDGFDLESAIDRLVDKAVEQEEGNVSRAARLLGVSRDYIRYRKKKRSEQ